MRLLYYSTPSFADCDFPLIKEYMEKGIDVLYLIKRKPPIKYPLSLYL